MYTGHALDIEGFITIGIYGSEITMIFKTKLKFLFKG